MILAAEIFSVWPSYWVSPGRFPLTMMSTPWLPRMRCSKATSARRGTLSRTSVSSVSRLAIINGSAAVFAPEIGMVPLSLRPPLMRMRYMVLAPPPADAEAVADVQGDELEQATGVHQRFQGEGIRAVELSLPRR